MYIQYNKSIYLYVYSYICVYVCVYVCMCAYVYL